MPKLTKSWLDKKEQPFDSSMLKVGEMMEVARGHLSCDAGEILIKTHKQLLSLTDLKAWSENSLDRIIGRKLQPGESITLTQE